MDSLTVIMYHYVRELKNTRYPKIKGLNVSDFKKQIEFFKKNFNIVSIEQILEHIYKTKNLPDKPLILTFDDGYSDHYSNVFPILKLHNIQGFFSMPAKILNERELLDVNKIHYILASEEENVIYKNLCKILDYYRGTEYILPSNEEFLKKVIKEESRYDSPKTLFIKRILQVYLPVELRKKITDELFERYVCDNNSLNKNVFIDETYLTMDQILLMKKEGMYFGNHGYSHDWLGKMNFLDMKEDIDKARNFWDDLIPRKDWVMCYPYGSYNNETLDYVEQIECKIGFGTEVGMAKLDEDNLLKLKRYDTNDFK